MTDNPKLTHAFARVGLIVGRFRDMDPGDTIAAVTAGDGGIERLTYGDLRDLQLVAFDAGDRLQRIATWHSRETADAGMVGDYCVECGCRWPCDTRRMAATADAEFIAHARTDIPALLEEIGFIDRDRDRLQESLTDMQIEAEQLHARANAAEQERDAFKADRDDLAKLVGRLTRTLAGTDDRTADRP